MFHALGDPSSCGDFSACPHWFVRLHHCSSCATLEENENCLEREKTSCPWPMSSHTCAHNRWQPGVLVFCTEAGNIHIQGTSESHALTACGQQQDVPLQLSPGSLCPLVAQGTWDRPSMGCSHTSSCLT